MRSQIPYIADISYDFDEIFEIMFSSKFQETRNNVQRRKLTNIFVY